MLFETAAIGYRMTDTGLCHEICRSHSSRLVLSHMLAVEIVVWFVGASGLGSIACLHSLSSIFLGKLCT